MRGWLSAGQTAESNHAAASGVRRVQAMSYGSALRRHRQERLIAPFRMIVALASMPTTPFVALLLTVICLMVLIMVGMLCARHWLLAAHGSTYVGRLKGEKVAEGGALGPTCRGMSMHVGARGRCG